MRITKLDLPACDLGESPLWSPEESAFYWVDGLAPALFRMDWKTGKIERQTLPDVVGSITRAADGRIVLAFSRSIGILRFGQQPETLFAADMLPENVRFNDSKCDPAGRLVAGTMDLAEQSPIGAAYCFDMGRPPRMIDSGYTVFNGPCWSASGTTLFLSDSAGMRVSRFDYDVTTGEVSGKTAWLQLEQADGLPDGATFDASGHFWQARNGAGKLAVHAGDGSLVQTIAMPTMNVTSLAFGGPGMDTILVTSMNRSLPWQDRLDADSGGVFIIEGLEHHGRREPAIRLTPASGKDEQ